MQNSMRAVAFALAVSAAVAEVLQLSKCGLAQDKELCKKPIKGCDHVTAIEDVATGWKDGCMDLHENVTDTTKAACEASCKANVNCSVWQWSGEGESAGPHCYMGVPDMACRSRSDFKANAGQRLQHGAVAVVKSALGMEVMNLMSFAEDSSNVAGSTIDVARCKQACYTDSTCSVWQYGMKSGGLGCWIEHGDAYKMTTIDTDASDGTFAAAVTHGEFISHYCPVFPPPEEDNIWIWLGPLLGVLALIAIVLTFVLLRPKKKIKKTRAIKIAPKEEAVPLWIPQPTVLIPQQQVVYQTVQQPQVVYQTVPQAVATQPLLSGSVVYA